MKKGVGYAHFFRKQWLVYIPFIYPLIPGKDISCHLLVVSQRVVKNPRGPHE